MPYDVSLCIRPCLLPLRDQAPKTKDCAFYAPTLVLAREKLWCGRKTNALHGQSGKSEGLRFCDYQTEERGKKGSYCKMPQKVLCAKCDAI